MKKFTDRNVLAGKLKKAVPLAAIAFFMCPAPSHAQSNTVLGTAFGTNAQQTVFSSLSDGFGYLAIGDPDTTGVVLSNNVQGTIGVENNFNTFTITATGGTLLSATNMVAPALSITGGTNLNIVGGVFEAQGGRGSAVLPPIPGGGDQIIITTNATEAATIQGVQHAHISGSRFEGTVYAPENNVIQGTDGLTLVNTTITFSDEGTNSSSMAGGNGLSIFVDNDDAFSMGGNGLFANNGSMIIVSNGVFNGGGGGTAGHTGAHTSYSIGGDAMRLEGAPTTIIEGTFTGGDADTAALSKAGSGLYAINSSSVEIHGGTLMGGHSASADISMGGHGVYTSNSTANIYGGELLGGNAEGGSGTTGGSGLYAIDSTVFIDGTNTVLTGGNGAAALMTQNSDLTVNNGTFTGGSYGTDDYYGLVSMAETGKNNNVVLNGGTFSSINFRGEGSQFLMVGAGLAVEDYLVVDDGTVTVLDSLSTSAFNNVFVRDGDLIFNTPFAMADGDAFTLLTPDSRAFFTDLNVGQNAALYVGQGEVDVSGDLQLSAGGTINYELAFDGVSLISADTATFESNSTINVNAEAAGLGPGTNDVRLAQTTSGIFVSDGTNTANATTENFNEYVNVSGYADWLTSFEGAFINGNNLDIQLITQTWGSSWDEGTQEAALADELQDLDDGTMAEIVSTMSQSSFTKAVEETYFTTFNTFQVNMQGLEAAVGQSISRGTEFREKLQLPIGPKGPEEEGEPANDWRLWGKYYGQLYERDRDRDQPSYDSYLHGGILGAEQSFGAVLLGVSGGFGYYRIESGKDAEQDMNAAHGAVYTTIGKNHSYLNAGLAYAFSQVDSETAEPFVLESEFDAHTIMAYSEVGIGFELADGSGVITPELGIQYTYYEQDSYKEESTTAVPRSFDDYDADSLRTSLGLNIAMLNAKVMRHFAFKVEGRGLWIHEFNPDPDDQSFQLQGGQNDYALTSPMLDEDAARIGVGFSFFNTKRSTKNIMLRIDFDELIGDGFNSHNLSAKAIYAF